MKKTQPEGGEFIGMMKFLVTTVSEMKSAVSKMQGSFDTMQSTVSDLQGTVSEMQDSFSQMPSTVSEMQSSFSQMQGTVSEMQKSLRNMATKDDVARVEKKVDTLDTKVDSMYVELKDDITDAEISVSNKLFDIHEDVRADMARYFGNTAEMLDSESAKRARLEGRVTKLEKEVFA